MLLNLSDVSNESLQAQIIRQVRAKILNGSLPAGEALPSIRGLARDTHVSVITVQRAYEFLEREGLIYSRRGKGFFISEIEQERKLEMAENKVSESLYPVLEAAITEGIDKDDLLRLVEQMIKKINQTFE